ncbi:mitotic apparatus protein p62-like isoform X2 [Bacillus rossius redtenbacheri]|uniref:mitotic apparatus protein p62-like isoform X2 n=1 Tax=Bacillus rossius redtenbacheri TaxID=93214 RepID=UPI002FDE8F7D
MSEGYFWGASLTADKNTITWDPEEPSKDGQPDFSRGHSLTIKQAMLGKEAKSGELNVVQAETVGYNGDVKIPLFSLEAGALRQCMLDLSFPDAPVVLKLAEGSGPVHLSGYHSIASVMDEQTDDELEDEGEEEMVDEVYDDEALANGDKADAKKRKLGNPDRSKTKKSKMEEDYEDEEDEDDDSPRKGKAVPPKAKKPKPTPKKT